MKINNQSNNKNNGWIRYCYCKNIMYDIIVTDRKK